MKITSYIDVHSSPKTVFGWLENPEKAREWMTSVSGGEILHESPNKVGTTFREVVEDENGSIEMYGEITGFEMDKSIAFHLESRVNSVEVEYRIKKIEAGVRLTYDADVRWKFPVSVISIFVGNKMRQNILAQLGNELNRLKEFCESEH